MDSLSRFNVALELLEADNQRFEFVLDDDFFAALDEGFVKQGALKAIVSTQKVAENIDVHIVIDGYVIVPCDRCLDDMRLPIAVDGHTQIIRGAQPDDDCIAVADDATQVNLAWTLYESIVLALPMVRMHNEGECNSEMMEIYRSHTMGSNQWADPRWDALKNISNNN